MHVLSPAASALLRRRKCLAPHAAEECLPTHPATSCGAGWQAKEDSSPAMPLTACCSGAVTSCVMLLSGGKGGYVRSRVSVLVSASLCTTTRQSREGGAARPHSTSLLTHRGLWHLLVHISSSSAHPLVHWLGTEQP